MRNKKGGKAIAAGGFGCVFNPALKCQGNARGTGVSKLLLKKYAEDEMKENKMVSNVLTKIPNYDDYFVGINSTSICDLEDLTDSDKIDFDSKCSNLTKRGINSTNINANLSTVKSIDIPYGGSEPRLFFNTNYLTIDNFVKVNKSLIKLLNNGIVPMNKLNLYHLDLKAPNILVGDDYKSRIIDWGLSGIQIDINIIPEAVKDRPFMYNAPFTICLFQSDFKYFIKNKITNIKSVLGIPISSLQQIKEDIRLAMHEWVHKFIGKGYQGHYDYIHSVLLTEILVNYAEYPKSYSSKISSPELNTVIYGSYLKNYIVNALTEVVVYYTSLEGIFDDINYFNNSYKHNVDIWGFLSTYYDILALSRTRNTANKLSVQQCAVLSHNIISIIHKYLFDPIQQIMPIDINNLLNDLKSLNTISGYASSPSPIVVASPVISSVNTPSVRIISAPKSRRSRRSRRSKSLSIPLPAAAKKTRKRHVVCDDAKKAKCISKGKICNETTGRCVNKKK
jgi:hypothetical protein